MRSTPRFTLIRLWLAWQRRLKPWFLALSVVVDITMLMVTIWSFHLQYQGRPRNLSEGADLLYAFILIALRTLRLEPGLVVLAGVTAAVGWLVLVGYAVLGDGGAQITRDFATYAMSYQVLLGAEIDKVVSVMMVTLILTMGLVQRPQAAVPGRDRSSGRHRAVADFRARGGRAHSRERHGARAGPGRAARCRHPDD